jgi:hypothetical protein
MIKKLVFAALLLSMASSVHASDTYVAQSSAGSSDGTSCANAYAYTDPVHGTNGGQTADQGPGKTIHLCGTITGNAADQAVNINASGSPGNPFTIKFETGAILTAPVWGGIGGAITVGGGAHDVTIDGGTNGVIQNTDNGTGLGHHDSSHGVYMQGGLTNIIIENLHILNICQHTSPTDLAGCSTSGNDATAIMETGAKTNVVITRNTLSDAVIGIRDEAASGDTGTVISWNTIRRMNWGINLGNGTDTGALIYGNDISCVPGSNCNWDTGVANVNHHNGIMFDPQSAGSLWANTDISGNYIHDVNPSSAYIFIDPLDFSLITGIRIYNNIFFTTAGQIGSTNGMAGCSTNGLIANNTLSGPDQLGLGSSANSPMFKNNVVVNLSTAELIAPGVTGTVSDYNDFFNLSGGAIEFQAFGTNFATLAAWVSGTGFDTHSISTNPKLTAAFMPSAGSPVIAAGTNLTSLGVSGLNLSAPQTFGATGSCGSGCVRRPTSGAWDIGAYQQTTSAQGPNPPTGLGKVVQ